MISKQPDSDVHTRYALQNKKGEFVGHRRSGEYRAGTSRFDRNTVAGLYGPFEQARIWVRRADAQRYATKNDQVVAITVVVGTPYAVFTEAP